MSNSYTRKQLECLQLGSGLCGGLAILAALSAQTGVDNVHQQVGESNDQISTLNARLTTLANNKGTLQSLVDTALVTANNVVTSEQYLNVKTTANEAKTQIDELCDGVSHRKLYQPRILAKYISLW